MRPWFLDRNRWTSWDAWAGAFSCTFPETKWCVRRIADCRDVRLAIIAACWYMCASRAPRHTRNTVVMRQDNFWRYDHTASIENILVRNLCNPKPYTSRILGPHLVLQCYIGSKQRLRVIFVLKEPWDWWQKRHNHAEVSTPSQQNQPFEPTRIEPLLRKRGRVFRMLW